MNQPSAHDSILGSNPESAAAAAMRGIAEAAYVPDRKPRRFDLRQNGRVLLVGGGLVMVLLLLAFRGVSRHTSTRRTADKNRAVAEAPRDSAAQPSISPILDLAPEPADRPSNLTSADQVLRTARAKPRPSPPATLASVPPFADASWQPPPYPGSLAARPQATPDQLPQPGKDSSVPAPAQSSLVFVAQSESPYAQPQHSAGRLSFRIAPGTRLRARLESEISSAVRSPVIAVIEDSYEEAGRVIVPAGSQATGRLLNADRSGYLELSFDSLELPSGSVIPMQATAEDLQLRPLRGQMWGKGTGKNLLVRSATGLGEIAATLLGRGSLNQPLSEGDMLRERLSDNIGRAGDQQLSSIAVSEKLVVTLPAGTEIYLVLEKESEQKAAATASQIGTVDQRSVDQLRQLLELQQELSQSSPIH